MRRLGYLPALDGVRGIAILAVIAYHLFGMRGGFYGVDLFFVLSGFLITTLLLEEHERHGRVSLRAFYVRRARRLLPALTAFLGVVAALGSAQRLPAGRIVAAVAWPISYCMNVAVAFHHETFRLPVDHLWSLAQEEQFYLLAPALLIGLLRRVRESELLTPLLALAITLAVYRAGLVAAGASYTRIYYGPDTHGDGLVIGCAASVLRRRGISAGTPAGVASAAVLLLAFVSGPASVGWSLLELPIVNLAAATVILSAASAGRFSRSISGKPLVWLGGISYSLYLWHFFAHRVVPGAHPVVELAIALPLALGSYYLVERPFRRRQFRRGAVEISEGHALLGAG